MSRKRILAPKLLFLPVFAVAFVSHHVWQEEGLMNLSLEVSALALIAIGAIGRIWVAAFVSGRKNQQLVTEGPYAIVRNPLYMFLAFVGAGLAFETFTFALLFAVLFFATHLPAIFAEEKFLRGKFGAQFDAYAHAVPRLIPRSWKPTCPAEIRFNTAVYSRAVLDSSLIVSMFLLAHVVEWGHLHHVLPVVFLLP
jgi:protein-S-isoprenylcysteine O-methyltransferase Ste14